jgi:hypothetical protein
MIVVVAMAMTMAVVVVVVVVMIMTVVVSVPMIVIVVVVVAMVVFVLLGRRVGHREAFPDGRDQALPASRCLSRPTTHCVQTGRWPLPAGQRGTCVRSLRSGASMGMMSCMRVPMLMFRVLVFGMRVKSTVRHGRLPRVDGRLGLSMHVMLVRMRQRR